MLTAENTYVLLLVVQALHLLHHRLARRHISFVEVTAGAVLCIPVGALPSAMLIGMHLMLAAVQVVGSLCIDKLSPRHDGSGPAATLG